MRQNMRKYAEIAYSHKSDIWYVFFGGGMDRTAIISTFKLIAKLESTCWFAVARAFGLYSIFLHLKLDVITFTAQYNRQSDS